MIDGAKVLEAIYSIANEKQIDKDIIWEGIKEGFQKAYEKFFDPEAIINVEVDEQTGQLKVTKELLVVKKVEDEWLEISLEDAKKHYGEDKTIDDKVYEPVEFTEEFSRLAILQFGQIIKQKIREGEKLNLYEKFKDRESDIVGGLVTDVGDNSYLVDIDGSILHVSKNKVIPGETFFEGQRMSFYIEEVLKESKYNQIKTSRTHPQFLVKLMEMEVPELQEGVVEVKAASRDAGIRAKIAVKSHDPSIDPIGSCVGTNGSRIKNVISELKGEKIDVVLFDEDHKQFIINALSPVKVISIDYNEEENEAKVVVPDYQLSLAIGKKGMAAKLVSRLVNSRINIFSQSKAIEEGVEILWNGNVTQSELDNNERNTSYQNDKKQLISEEEIDTSQFETNTSLDDIEANRNAFETISEDEEEIEVDNLISDNLDDYYDN